MKIYIPFLALLLSISAQAVETSSYATTPDDRSWMARAGLMVEPSIEWVTQNANIRTSGLPLISQDTSSKNLGYGFGLRLTGHVMDTVFVGADARYLRIDMRDSSLGQASGDSYNLGPVIGAQMPIAGLRLWYARILGGEFNPGSGAHGVDVKFNESTGNRFGVGFHIMAVSLNLEYEELRFNRTSVESVGALGVNTSTGVDYDQKGFLASVSFPISL